MTAGGRPVRLAEFLSETGLELEDVYAGTGAGRTSAQRPGLSTLPPGPNEEVLRRACGRMLHVDDDERLMTYRAFSSGGPPVSRR